MWAAVLVASALGCAAGTSGPQRPPLALTLQRPDRSVLDLSQLRGAPVLLFLFTTFDDTSQLALGALLEARPALPSDVQVLGIALQPNARSFLPAYADALAVDFPLLADPRGDLLAGRTGLGSPVSVPSFVYLDADGHPVATWVGAATADDLVRLARRGSHPN